jgi:hypothetical protein
MCIMVIPYISFCGHKYVERCILSFARREFCDKKNRETVVAPLVGWCVVCAGRATLWSENDGAMHDDEECEYPRPRSPSSDVLEFGPETGEVSEMRSNVDRSVSSACQEGYAKSSRNRESTGSASSSSTESYDSWNSDSSS